MIESILSWSGMSETLANHPAAHFMISVALAAVVVFVILLVTRQLVFTFVSHSLKRFKIAQDEESAKRVRRFARYVGHMAAASVLIIIASSTVGEAETSSWLLRLSNVYFYIAISLSICSFLNVVQQAWLTSSKSKKAPVKGAFQVLKLITVIIISILIIAELFGYSPAYLLSSLGAVAALLILVFKDTILGLVAGVQLAANRMIANGDWIEMPKYGADGEVLEVGLNTVKVRNWDHTITTIPTYALISDSFKNWRGMEQSQGRRIKKVLWIDVNSVKPVKSELLKQEFATESLNEWLSLCADSHESGNMTNLGLFRRYADYYLSIHENVNQSLTYMIRLLPLSEYGVGVEIYCFSREKAWKHYEHIQADIVEQLLVAMTAFDLRPYQRPISESVQSA